MKTARFTDLVGKSGAPEPHSLWVAPRGDPAFQRALKQHRVLTVHQETGSAKKDFGQVGFHEQPGAQYLVFPRSIQRFADRRVVGINYDLLAPGSQPVVAAPARSTPPRRAGSAHKRTQPAGSTVPATPEAPRPIEVAPAAAAKPTSRGNVPDRGESAKPAKAAKAAGAAAQRSAATSLRVVKLPELRDAAATAAGPGTAADRHVLDEVKRAMKELKSGKAVAAYERLQALVAQERA